MATEKQVNSNYQLKKFPGNGGWTYAAIPEIPSDSNNPFGWVKVSGTIDDYPLKQVKLMPMGNCQLFLPVKAKSVKQLVKNPGILFLFTLRLTNHPW